MSRARSISFNEPSTSGKGSDAKNPNRLGYLQQMLAISSLAAQVICSASLSSSAFKCVPGEVMLRIDLEILSLSISSMWDSGLQACFCRQPALHCSYSLSPSLTYGYSGHTVRHPPAIFLALLSPTVGYYVAMGVYFLHFDCQFSAILGGSLTVILNVTSFVLNLCQY